MHQKGADLGTKISSSTAGGFLGITLSEFLHQFLNCTHNQSHHVPHLHHIDSFEYGINVPRLVSESSSNVNNRFRYADDCDTMPSMSITTPIAIPTSPPVDIICAC